MLYEHDGPEVEEYSQAYINGFCDGLRDSRNEIEPGEIEHESEDYQIGYNEGYMEGLCLTI